MHLFLRIERFFFSYMYHSREKHATRIINRTGHNVINKKTICDKTFDFADKLKTNICVTENNKENHMLLHVFHLRTNDVKAPPRNAWILPNNRPRGHIAHLSHIG
jgi:hypothetical protein